MLKERQREREMLLYIIFYDCIDTDLYGIQRYNKPGEEHIDRVVGDGKS